MLLIDFLVRLQSVERMRDERAIAAHRFAM